MKYNKGRWACGYCKACFENKIDLIIHEEQVHPVECMEVLDDK